MSIYLIQKFTKANTETLRICVAVFERRLKVSVRYLLEVLAVRGSRLSYRLY